MAGFRTIVNALSLAGLINPLVAQDTTVQVAFKAALNFDWVLAHPTTAVQIIDNLPPAIAYGLQVAPSSVVFQEMAAYDTSSTLGYNTTLAYLTIPTGDEVELQDQIRNSTSAFFSNPVALQAAIIGQVNTDIDVFPVIPPTGIVIIDE